MSTVPDDITTRWDRFSSAYQASGQLSTDTAHYGPDIPNEAELRLLGDLKGRRVLELGCGGMPCSVSFAKQGATVCAVDTSNEQLARARRVCETEEVRVELRQGDLADLAFLRADSIDLVFSAYAFGYVDDLNRVFRQVHRVLKVGAPLVFSLPHPAYDLLDELAGADGDPAMLVRRAYFQPGLTAASSYHRTFGDLYMGLSRASYRVDLVLEPEPTVGAPRGPWWRDSMAYVPRTLIVRARKEGN
jgi:ubiquinone/menaquinone biosynthesis C-methylase UbiE